MHGSEILRSTKGVSGPWSEERHGDERGREREFANWRGVGCGDASWLQVRTMVTMRMTIMADGVALWIVASPESEG